MKQAMKQEHIPTLLQLVFWLLTRLIGWLILGCFGCVATSIVIIVLQGPHGFTFLNQLTQGDYQYLMSHITQRKFVEFNHCFEAIPESIMPPDVLLPIVSRNAQQALWPQCAPYINAMLIGIKLLLIRLYLLLHWCPLFLIFGTVGFVDGLARRYIRRQCVARESALIYHNARSLIMFSLILGSFMDLMLPVSVSYTEYILIISAMTFGFAIQITAKNFKKYL